MNIKNDFQNMKKYEFIAKNSTWFKHCSVLVYGFYHFLYHIFKYKVEEK